MIEQRVSLNALIGLIKHIYYLVLEIHTVMPITAKLLNLSDDYSIVLITSKKHLRRKWIPVFKVVFA